MTTKEQLPKVNVTDEIKEPSFADSFRVSYTEGSFGIDFGLKKQVDGENLDIAVVAKVIIPDFRIVGMLGVMLEAIREYEQEFNKVLIATQKEV